MLLTLSKAPCASSVRRSGTMPPLLAALILIGACSSNDEASGPTRIAPIPTLLQERPVFFPDTETLGDTVAKGEQQENAPETPAPTPDPPTAPIPAPGPVTGVTLPDFGTLADTLAGRVPETTQASGQAVLPQLQNRFRSNDDYDLWGCNPSERSASLIVYSFLGTFGVLTVPDPVTGSPQNARAETYTVTETAPGTVLLSYLGLGRAEELGQFRFAPDGNGYEAFSTSWGPIACGRISAGELP